MYAEQNLRVRLTLGGAFLLMGFSFSVTQSLLVREMLVSFAGNELSIGVILGSWLLLEAVGSALLGRMATRIGRGARSYARLQVLFALLLLPVLCLTFGVRHLMGGVPGQGFGLPLILLASFLLLIPLGLVDGAMFTVGCRVDDLFRRDGVSTVGRVYVHEAVGGILGGLVFTYLFIPHLHSVQVALILAVLNLSSGLSLALLPGRTASSSGRAGLRPRLGRMAVLLLLALGLALLLTPGADRLHDRLAAWQWRGYDLAFYGHSVYGNVAAIRQGEQFTFLANGVPIITAPVPDIVLAEELVHLPLLFVSQPQRALVLGGGLGGVIGELLKYPLVRVDYAELDPLLIEAVASLPTPLTVAELNDPRLHIEQVDGRLLVRRLAADRPSRVEKPLLPHRGEILPRPGAGAYDLVLVNLPYPTTLQLNRFYTVEFWRLVRSLLAEDGVIAFPAPGSLTYLSPAMRDLHNAKHATRAAVFPHVRAIPGDVTLWLASPSGAIESMAIEELTERWEERGLPTRLMTSFHVRLKLDDRWLTWFWNSLRKGGRVVVNRDLRPSALLYGLAHWNEVFSPGLVPYFELLGRLSLSWLVAIVVVVSLVGLLVVRSRGPGRAGPLPIAIAATGFGGMTANLLIVFAFQTFFGYVYHLIGLLTAAFMAGLSLGGWVMTHKARGSDDPLEMRRERRSLVSLEVAIVAFWLALPVALTMLHGGASAIVGPALLLLNALAGFLVGAQFPVANRLFLRRHAELSGTAGALYAADLVGGCAAALFVSVALVPALGILQTCLLVAVLKAGSLLVMVTARGSS